MKESSGTTQGLWQLLLPHKPNKSAFVYLALLVIGATGLELILPLYSSYLVDSIGSDGIETYIIIGLIVIVLTTAILEAFLGWYGGKIGHTISLNLRYSLIGRLLSCQTQSMDQEHSAELSARVINDSKEVKSVLAEDLIGLLSGVISLVAVIVIMFILDWRLTLVLVSCVLLGFIIITPIALMMNNIGQAQQTAEANLLKYVTEWLRYGKLIKSHNAASQMQHQSKQLLDASFKHEMRATKVMSLIGPIANLVLMISMIAILAFSAYWLKQGTLTLGTITAFLLYLFGLIFPLMSMAMFFSNLNKAAGAASRLSEIDAFEKEPAGSGVLIDEISRLSVENLNFIRNGKTILENVNYQFEGCGFSVLLGESGSGKSTLLSQFLGFYPDTFEQVLINNKPLSAYNLSSVRQAIAWVDQEPKLLHATVYENLTLGLTENIERDHIISILKSVGLTAWLTRIENNLDLVVSEQAHQFSGGEKQRFAIARAILRQSKVLLLDEPTSALDDINKKELLVLLRQLAIKMRVIVITHHLDIIEASDDVIEMVAGKLARKIAT
ncbi:ABC transporter ATP-binding protein [Colwellia sp. 1_MG-2023]|uniref:ABC transporter ATP-binding protein n=1 Tax=Colwellia sp. 1_MG-2023 TaxID=3062649 RepID=UPI0026E150A5|nr:ABC transporter ATP-binding protein [Colwellia sp. 1_MG-2023]MDO6444802.1 ABC transporter ATP-binding protein [Colwellia sp. 1_MG-2023]